MTGFQKLMIGIGILFLVCIGLCLFGFLFLPDNEDSTVPIEVVSKSPTVAEKTTVEPKEVKAPFKIKTDQEGLTIEITKITNDDVLRIYAKYTNNTGQLIDLTTSLCKIVADGKQQDQYNDSYLDLNSNVLYELENGVSYEQIIPFDKIKSNTFNLVFNCNYEDYRINNIFIGEEAEK